MTTFAFPTLSIGPQSAEFWQDAPAQEFRSSFDGSVQTVELAGSAAWQFVAEWPTLTEADARIFNGWLAQLRGYANRFTAYNWQRPVPNGTINLSGVTTSSSLSIGSTSVNLAGCGNTKTLLIGDMIGINGELKMVVATDKTSDAGGAISAVTFEPPMRAAITSGAAVTLDKPTAVFKLEGDAPRPAVRPPVFTSITLVAKECWT